MHQQTSLTIYSENTYFLLKMSNNLISLYTFNFSQHTLSYPVCNLQSTPKIKGMSKKEGAKRKINMSGYILFSSEVRSLIKARHPDYSFGELSRLVGTEWRNLETTKKAEYEGKPKHHLLRLQHLLPIMV